MKKIVSVEKMSKRARKDFYSSKRGSWDGLNPVTRTGKSNHSYKEKKYSYAGM